MNNGRPQACANIYKHGRLKTRKEMIEDGTVSEYKLKEYEEAGWPPDLHGWHQLGIDMGATHMVISFDDGFYPPSYAIPGVETLERVEHSCESSGHIHGIYNLSKPLTQEEIDRFYKCYW